MYLALENGTAADRERIGGTLKLGAQQFSNLGKAWIGRSEALSLTPGIRHPALSKSRRDGVDPRAREIARQKIAEHGATARLPILVKAVRDRCACEGLVPPSRGTIWLLAMEARGVPQVVKPHNILVGRAYLRLPVDMGNDIIIPEIVVAVENPTGRILDLVMVGPNGKFDVCRIAAAISDRHQASALGIVANEDDADQIAAFLPPSFKVTRDRANNVAKALANILGRNIGRIKLIYRQPTIRPSTIMLSGRDRAPNLIDATTALQYAAKRHNAELEAVA